MDHFAGLDVSVKETSVCILDDAGRIVKEVKVASEPLALLKVLGNPIYCFKRIGLEAGPLSQWLFSALAEAELPVICVEMRHMQAVLKAQINKTDRNDARGIAQMMRVVIGDIRNVTGHCAWLVLSCSISCSTVPAREAPWRLAALGINSRSHVSSSSSFFASFRSAVSNPSVNQPYTGASTSRASVRRPVRPIDVRDYF